MVLRGIWNRVISYNKRTLIYLKQWTAIGLKMSARNQFKGTVENVEKGAVAASVKVRVEGPITVTALISKEAVEDLKLQRGDKATVVIKATEVIVAKE
jgi:molybdopterin-binding protein